MKSSILDIDKYQKPLFVLAIILNILLAMIIFATLDENQLSVYFNTDTLYLPSIYKDVFLDKTGLSGWHMNAAPNFLPDMLFFFIISTLFDNFITSCFAYSLLQFTILLTLMSLLYKSLSDKINYIHLSFATLLMTLFLLVTLINNDFQYTFYLFSISFHLGAFIMTLVSLLFLFRYIKTGKISDLIILLALGVTSTVSDLLYLIMFSFPVATLIFLSFTDLADKIRLRNILSTNVLSIILGLLTYMFIKKSGYIHTMGLHWLIFKFENIIPSLKYMFTQHLSYITNTDFRGIIDILFLTSFVFHSFFILRYFVRLGKEPERTERSDIEIFYLLFFVAFSFSVIFAPVINGSYMAVAILRYNIYVLYLGVFSYAFLIYKFIDWSNLSVSSLGLFILAFFIVGAVFLIGKYDRRTFLSGLSEFLSYYPEEVKCIDQLSRDEDLKYGVGDYWHTKYVTMFSKEDVRVYSVFDDLTVWYHAGNENWYHASARGKFGNPKFNFVILKWINRDKLRERLHEPLDTFFCPKGFEINKYPEFEFDKRTRIPRIKD